MTSKKSIRLGKSLRYELLLIFDRFKGLSVKEIFQKLPQGYTSLKSVYNWHARYKRADREARELMKNF